MYDTTSASPAVLRRLALGFTKIAEQTSKYIEAACIPEM